MKSFKNQLSEAAGKNTHMIHIEDLIIDGGVKGGAPSYHRTQVVARYVIR